MRLPVSAVSPKEIVRHVEPWLLDEPGVRTKIRRIDWADVAAMHATLLMERARQAAERLYPVIGAGPPYANVFAAFVSKLKTSDHVALANALEPKLVYCDRHTLLPATQAVIGTALGVLAGAALCERGARYTTGMGEPVLIEWNGHSLDVFELAHQAATDVHALDALEERVNGAPPPAMQSAVPPVVDSHALDDVIGEDRL